MPGNGRRFWQGRRVSVPEMIVGAVLDRRANAPKNVPIDPTLPVELQGIIQSGDYRITVRGHHTKCWIWDKNRMRLKDPVSGRSKEVTEIIYRIYSGQDVPSGKAIQHKCGQDRCINYDHFTLIRQREVDVIYQLHQRSAVDINEIDREIIRKLAKRYDWTEKEQTLIFNVTILQLRETYWDRVDSYQAEKLDPDNPEIIELDIPPEPDRPLPELETRPERPIPPEPETPPERPTPPAPETPPEPEPPPNPSVPAVRKSKTTAALLAFLLGGIGAHKFYLGYTGAGLIHLGLSLTVIGALINVPVCVVEFLIYLSKSDEEFHRIYVLNRKRFF